MESCFTSEHTDSKYAETRCPSSLATREQQTMALITRRHYTSMKTVKTKKSATTLNGNEEAEICDL